MGAPKLGSLEGKVAMITGAARGNGEGAARVMGREGAIAVLTDILDEVHATAKNIRDHGYQAISFKMDVTKPAEATQVVQSVLEQFAGVDILVNNAGVAILVPFVEVTDEVRDKISGINLKGPLIVTKAVLPSMVKQHYGKIVNASSVSGPLVADVGEGAYGATKAGLLGFAGALALEFARYGINLNAICPGMIESPMVRQIPMGTNPQDPEGVLKQLAMEIPMKRLGTTEESGELVVFLASDESKYITGTPILINGESTLLESPGSFNTLRRRKCTLN